MGWPFKNDEPAVGEPAVAVSVITIQELSRARDAIKAMKDEALAEIKAAEDRRYRAAMMTHFAEARQSRQEALREQFASQVNMRGGKIDTDEIDRIVAWIMDDGKPEAPPTGAAA